MPIIIRGASENNLQNVDVEFGDGLTVVTGVSGSGKTSLVFDTLYHEARRRFLEIFSLGAAGERLAPARVGSIRGLGPAVAVGQNLLNRNPASTLATACGLHPFLRLLYANFSERGCPQCGAGLQVLSEDAIVERLVELARRASLSVYAPLLRNVPGSHRTLLALLAEAFDPQELRVDGQPWRSQPLDPAQPHTLEVEVARLAEDVSAAQARQAVERVRELGASAVMVRPPSPSPFPLGGGRGEEERAKEGLPDGRLPSPLVGEGPGVRGSAGEIFSLAPVCPACGAWFGELEPVHFHTPCPHCAGQGCERCAGSGLHPAAAAARWSGLRLPELLARSVDEVSGLVGAAAWPSGAARLRSETARRLEALQAVGLGYLTLDRSSPSLSRGEAQRVRLAVALTGRLEDLLHVLDEPTVGQHPADVARLLPAFRRLAGPVIFVEHDRAAAAAADRVIDLGPGAGHQGGRVVFTGTPAGLWAADTPSGRYFSLRSRVSAPPHRPPPQDFLTVRGARLRNLQDIDVPIPLARLGVVTGVSGSGKSTLVEDVLVASLKEGEPRGCQAIEGPPLKPVLVDQSPIGLNPRSNPATYTRLADIVRDVFAAATGLSASHFSFNRSEGACPACAGMGALEVHMRYLPSAWIPCAACGGQRFSDEVLEVRAPFAGGRLSIADFYRLSVAEALPLLAGSDLLAGKNRAAALRILQALQDVGLGYLTLGQPSPTLSGGEAQRVKLARHLGQRLLSGQLLVLDEPSTGLHPQDVAGLLVVLDRLVRSGATILVVEHNTDIIRAADWVIDLGPGAGAQGGKLVYSGLGSGLTDAGDSLTGRALREEQALQPGGGEPAGIQTTPEIEDGVRGFRRSGAISIRGARAHNLRDVSVDIPKGALTVVTGVSGSGKSSLVGDVLEAEARRRFLETLSMYERQSTREGPEATVESLSGLGVAVAVGPERGRYHRRASVGTHTEISHHLAALLAAIGQRACLGCGGQMEQRQAWECAACGATAPLAEPRHFSPTTYAAACQACHGVGTQQVPRPEKLIIHPEKPLLDGAMYSPGFFPQGYLGKPFNGGYDMVQALAARYGFDPMRTPWNEIAFEARQAFLFGDPEPMEVTFYSRTGRTHTGMHKFPGFYGWIRDWDVGGTYTVTEPCPACGGTGMRPEYLAVTLAGKNIYELSQMPLSALAQALQGVTTDHPAASISLNLVRRRLGFLIQVGLGYLHLERVPSTLSAGEAQRVKLAGLLGSGLTSLTVLLDEPSRGLHPAEVEALKEALLALREEGNTVIVVEHDPLLMRAADYLIDMGPGAGAQGGEVVAQGSPQEVLRTGTLTARWLRGERALDYLSQARFMRTRSPGVLAGGSGPHKQFGRAWDRWMEIRGARANNLRGDLVRLPLGALVGVCGPSGSGKSTLIIDTLGRALAPKKQTTSVAYEPVAPGEHDAIVGAPGRAILVDQARAGVTNPADFLDLSRSLRRVWARSEDARALGLDENALGRSCSACGGSGVIKTYMGFLPDIFASCDACRGTGYLPEAWEVRLHGLALPELFSLTIDGVYGLLGDEESVTRPLAAARQVGLGYLVLRQPGVSLSGGEAQRLKIAQELCRKAPAETLYILDEPTVGQHLEDVARLVGVLHGLVEAGHTVLVVEHHPHLLAACDWLVELGPGGGPDGGQVIAAGPPVELARGETPTAPYLYEILNAQG